MEDFDIEKVSLEDPKTFELLNQGKTVGVFQLESGGMQSLCKQIGLSVFEEIIALVALYRPGPMQFIPTTWAIRGRDGDGDGIADPHNLYDAALAAGRYLCRLGGDLRQPDNLREAYFGYNTSSAYVELVERHAQRYREADLPDPGPIQP